MLGVPVWKLRYNSYAFIWHLCTHWLYLGVAQVYLCILDVSFVSFPLLLQNINKRSQISVWPLRISVSQ